MKIYNLKPRSKVKYVGKTNSLRYGVEYIIESNFIFKSTILIKLEGIEEKFPGEDFEGTVICSNNSVSLSN